MFLESYGDQYGVRVTPSHEGNDSYPRPANFIRLCMHTSHQAPRIDAYSGHVYHSNLQLPVSSTALRIPCSAGVIRDSLT